MSGSCKRWSRYAGGNSVWRSSAVVRSAFWPARCGGRAGHPALAERRGSGRGAGGSCLGRGPLIGGLIGLLRGRSVHLAAATVDRVYGLKDRAATAIEFIRRGQPTPMHVLQVADAQRHLRESTFAGSRRTAFPG